jgi:hypothetical protein
MAADRAELSRGELSWGARGPCSLFKALRSPDGQQTYTRLRDPRRVAGYYADTRHNAVPT